MNRYQIPELKKCAERKKYFDKNQFKIKKAGSKPA
jgi:hypothetical protein